MTAREQDDALLGAVVGGRYRVVRRIAAGGMGAIYEVAHLRLKRRFALKTVSRSAASNEEALARFRREADVVAAIRHAHIVDVVDWETLEDGSPCLLMELLEGVDLGQRIGASGPLPWSEIARIGEQILSGLSVAHENGVIHRDLKPPNVFLARDAAGEEAVKLLDFGISKVRHSQTFETTDSTVLGTPGYMAPEQAEGELDRIGPATDLWAVGAMLVEMAIARPAFSGPSTPSILFRICHRAPEPIAPDRPDAPEAFLELVAHLLKKDPADRPANAGEVRARLASALAPGAAEPGRGRAETPAASATTTPIPARGAPAPTRSRRARRALLLATLAIAAGAAVLALLARSGEQVAGGGGADWSDAAAPPAPAAALPEPDGSGTAPKASGGNSPDRGGREVGAAPGREVSALIESRPSGARIIRVRDGAALGTTPARIHLKAGAGEVLFELELPGFESAEVAIPSRRDSEHEITLQRLSEPEEAERPRAPERRRAKPRSRRRAKKRVKKRRERGEEEPRRRRKPGEPVNPFEEPGGED